MRLSRNEALICLSWLANLAFSVASEYAPVSECRAFPGSFDWPSDRTWRSLNETLGGHLLAPAPPGAACHRRGHASFDVDECQGIQTNWSSYQWHTENPISVTHNQFTRFSCLPDPKVPCSGQGYPPYVVNASTAEHVKVGVDFARRHNIRLVVKGTGHDFVGRSTAPGALSIWTHHMREITFHPSHFKLSSGRALRGSAVTVGAGAQLLDIYRATDKHGQTIVGGAGRSVGITGYVTGAGHSVLAPRYGLAADNVLEMEVVTPAGRMVTVNEDHHSDLFWAMRGGGGSTFGVVTKITMWTHPTPKILGVRWMVVVDAASPFLYDVAADVVSMFPQLRRSGLSGWGFVANRIADPIPESGRNSTAPLAGVYGVSLIQDSDDSRVAQEVFKPVQDMVRRKWRGKARLILQTEQYPSFLAWISKNYDTSSAGNSMWAVSRLLDERALTTDAKALGRALREGNKASGSLMVFLVSGKGAKEARLRGGGNGVNPAWRSAEVHALTVAEYAPFNKTAEQDAISLLDTSFQPMRDLAPQSGAYVNEALPFERDWQHSFWGSNYERLVRIKRRVDPTDVLWCSPCVGNARWREHHDGRLCRIRGSRRH